MSRVAVAILTFSMFLGGCSVLGGERPQGAGPLISSSLSANNAAAELRMRALPSGMDLRILSICSHASVLAVQAAESTPDSRGRVLKAFELLREGIASGALGNPPPGPDQVSLAILSVEQNIDGMSLLTPERRHDLLIGMSAASCARTLHYE